MPEPSIKSEAYENFLQRFTGFDRREVIKTDRCAPMPFGCNREMAFSTCANEIERNEYTISGLCGTCQRNIFGQPEVEVDEDGELKNRADDLNSYEPDYEAMMDHGVGGGDPDEGWDNGYHYPEG